MAGSKYSAEKLAELLEDARKQGLPQDWMLSIDENGRKRWTSSNGKGFSYLQRALDYVNGGSKSKKISKKRPASGAAKTDAGGDPSQASSTTSGKKSKKAKRGNKSSNSSSGLSSSALQSPSSTNGNVDFDHPPSPKKKSQDVYSDPETSLDLPADFDDSNIGNNNKCSRSAGTVHWDPNSPAGSKVGYRIRVYDFEKSYWKSGRIVRYDPISHKHKVIFFHLHDRALDRYQEEWIHLDRENIQLGGKFVWALVKGFAWWPAQVLHCTSFRPFTTAHKRDMTTQPPRDGYLLVEFFDSDEVASVKNSPDFIRPFQNGAIDAVIRKNKKKRNARAVETCRQEEETTREVRNDAARYYAEKCFECINARAMKGPAGLSLGTKVEIFRSDINYPVGDHVVGTVRMYSTTTKRYLVTYEPSPRNQKHHDPTWVNMATQHYKVIDDDGNRKKPGSLKNPHVPSDIDLYPYLFGYMEKDGSTGTRCRGCVSHCDPEEELVLHCSVCGGNYHPGCLDPPMATRTAENIVKNADQGNAWTCPKCVRCDGCRELEIVFGAKAISSPPSSLYLPRNGILHLCVSCVPMYDKEMFCPICAHVWDDARYQKVQRRIEATARRGLSSLSSSSLPPKKRKALVHAVEADAAESSEKASSSSPPNKNADAEVEMSRPEGEQLIESNFRWKSSQSVKDSWFYPENDVWGYNEGTMLGCENCNLWVHAGCAELSKEEYEQTTKGDHPVYSKEYLCRTCCKAKCIEIMNLLHEQDTMYLFAAPVTDTMAHNYSDIIKNPMDLQTMTDRAHIGNYRNYAWLQESFELMVYNALVFNHPQSKYWNEAKRYYYACKKSVFGTVGKGAPSSKYKALIKERFEYSEKLIQDEKDRMKADTTVEKKDLVVGSEVLAVTVGPLVTPPDPPSCVLTTVVRMNSIDAFYSSWLEGCFSCGSSGAIDTMLFCVDCGEAYHSFCANAPIHSMNDAAVDGWRCPNCKLCEITGEVTDDETKLLYCEMCDRAFSLDLISPPLESAPSGLWICGQCVNCKSCDNKSDNGVINRTFWSRDPEKCLPCGGCSGLSLKSLQHSKCSVCKKYSRQTDDLPQCSTCNSFIHLQCDKDAIEAFRQKKDQDETESSAKYSCKKCRKRAAIAARRKEESSKNRKKNKEAKAVVQKEPPKKRISKEEQREEALVTAMKEAQKRGLPDGWSVFYGSANRKRWRSPPPNSRVFDSIPKALLYAERVRNGENVSRPKSSRKVSTSGPSFKFFELKLDEEADWQSREKGYDESTSLMSDAEVLLKILEAKIDLNMSLIFDQSGKLFQSSKHLRDEDLPKWVLSRAGRFVRFVKRLRNRSARTTRRRGMMSNRSAQTVVCKMASAFIYSVCIMFKIDTKKTIKCWKKMESLLIAVDEISGTVDLKLDDKKKRYLPTVPVGSDHSHARTLKIPDGIVQERQIVLPISSECTQQSECLNQTMAQIPYHKLNIPTDSIDHVPLELPSFRKTSDLPSASLGPQLQVDSLPKNGSFVPENSESERCLVDRPAQNSTRGTTNLTENSVRSKERYQTLGNSSSTAIPGTFVCNASPSKTQSVPHVPAFDPRSGKTENEYSIASALMMLTATPTRLKSSTSAPINSSDSTVSYSGSTQHQNTGFSTIRSRSSASHNYSSANYHTGEELHQSSQQNTTCSNQNVYHGFSTSIANPENHPNVVTSSIPNQSANIRASTVGICSPFHTSNAGLPQKVASCEPNQAVATMLNSSSDMKRMSHSGSGTSPSHGFRINHVHQTNLYDSAVGTETIVINRDSDFSALQSFQATKLTAVPTASQDFTSQNENTIDITACRELSSRTMQESMADAALLLSAANGVSSTQSLFNSQVVNTHASTLPPNTNTVIPAVAEATNSSVQPSHSVVKTSHRAKPVPNASKFQAYDDTSRRDDSSGNHGNPLQAPMTMPVRSPTSEKVNDEKVPISTPGIHYNSKVPSLAVSWTSTIASSNDQTGTATDTNIAKHSQESIAVSQLSSTPTKADFSESTETSAKLGLDDPILTCKREDAKAQSNVVPDKDKVNLPWFTHNFVKVKPVIGWDTLSDNSSSGITKWVDSRTCCLCNISGDDDIGLESDDPFATREKIDRAKGSGRLLPLPDGNWIHAMCAFNSSEVWENPVGGILNGVTKAKARSTKLRCFGCGQTGATLGCHRSSCNANFHFPCAKACGAVFTKSHKFYCAAHKSCAKDELIEHFSEPMKILRVVDEKYEASSSLCYRTGSLVVHSLGKIDPDNDGFHSRQYITPDGYSSTRIFWSFMKPKTRTVYFMRITRSPKNTAYFTLIAADAPSEVFKGYNASKVYNDLMQRVRHMNKDFFSHGDLFSVYPMIRSKNNRIAFCLNGPQFFGFGVNAIREALEKSLHAVSLIVPISETSTPYQFCFQNPTQQSVTDLQRKRALVKAEKDLENATGCARTEGIGAIDKSKGSGRITRALVRSDKDYSSPSRSRTLTKGATNTSDGGRDPRARNDLTSSREFESIQAKYREMKSVPMERRLAAKRSHIHGWGLFAKKDYPKNSMIAEYMGEAISQPIADKREKMYEILGMGSCYMFRLDLHEIVDATQIGCMARFMNHCCSANAYANIITVNTERGLEKKIVVFANQDIKSGDEITYDYKFPVEDGSLRCTCGAPNCNGRLN